MLGDRMFDDEFNAREHERFETEALRYYSNIIASFGPFVKRAIDKLSGFDIRVVAPSHGIVWRKDPRQDHRALQEVRVLPRRGPREGSVRHLGLDVRQYRKGPGRGHPRHRGRRTALHDAPRAQRDASYILSDAYKSEGILVAMPTYEYKMFPPMAYVLDLLARKHVNGRSALHIGSWGWVGGAKKEYDEALTALKWNSIESLEWAGVPDEAVLAACARKAASWPARSKPRSSCA